MPLKDSLGWTGGGKKGVGQLPHSGLDPEDYLIEVLKRLPHKIRSY
jgi:hypothetical protein